MQTSPDSKEAQSISSATITGQRVKQVRNPGRHLFQPFGTLRTLGFSSSNLPPRKGPYLVFSHMQDIPEEKQNDFKQAGDRYRNMSLRE